MLDIGWSEMAVVAVIALIIIGPKDLPRILRYVGRWAGKARAMAREFQSSVDDMMREAELDEVKKSVESVASYDVKKQIEKAVDPTGVLTPDLDPTAAESKSETAGEGVSPAAEASTESAAAGPAESGTVAAKPVESEPAESESAVAEPAESGTAAAKPVEPESAESESAGPADEPVAPAKSQAGG
ncbi:MAG: Sec-independent protein translocase protein TatB [Alphaproteobacteria bacterium]